MRVATRASIVTLVGAGVTFPLTFLVWPPMVPPGAPTKVQIFGYGLLVAESLAMGAGIAFLLFGYPAVKRLPVSPPLATASYVGIGFFLTNWWTHDHLHVVSFTLPFDQFLWMSVAIDYVFHIGMMLFAGVVALFFVRSLLTSINDSQRATPAPAGEKWAAWTWK